MTRDTDVDRLAAAWMADGPEVLSDHVLSRTLDEIHHTRQRRSFAAPWRFLMSLTPSRAASVVVAIGAIGVVAALGLGVALLPDPPAGPGTGSAVAPGATTAPSSAPSATPADTPSSPAPDGAALAPLGSTASGRITYTREADGYPVAWLVNPDGTGEVRLWPDGGNGLEPDAASGTCCAVISPDGRRVAVTVDRAAPGGGATVMIADAATGATLDYLPVCGACGFPTGSVLVPRAWTPDGDRIAIEIIAPDEGEGSGIGIATLPSREGAGWERQVTGDHRDIPIAFSPDGTRLLFVRVNPAHSDDQGPLHILDVPRGSVTTLTPDGVEVIVNHYLGAGASWSPDGTQVAYAGTDAAGSRSAMRVVVVAADGTGAYPLTEAADHVTSAQWSPDGRWIAFDRRAPAPSGGFHDLYLVSPERPADDAMPDARSLTDGFTPGVCCTRWAPDSTALLVAGTASTNDASQLLVVPVDGGEIRRITTVASAYDGFGWAPAYP